jgi:hypothetical protein
VRAYLNANEHLYANGIEPEHLLETVKALKGDFPFAKGKHNHAIMSMVTEACYDHSRLKKPRCPTGGHVGSDMSG